MTLQQSPLLVLPCTPNQFSLYLFPLCWCSAFLVFLFSGFLVFLALVFWNENVLNTQIQARLVFSFSSFPYYHFLTNCFLWSIFLLIYWFYPLLMLPFTGFPHSWFLLYQFSPYWFSLNVFSVSGLILHRVSSCIGLLHYWCFPLRVLHFTGFPINWFSL